jgi:cysteinyl-tRNA synthetase
MTNNLTIYNSLSRKKERFEPIVEGHIGMYVCGPTVYSDVHLGNCLTFVKFDLIYRYLLHLGYKVRYVRNITDVGHLEGDSDIGTEDKISKKARLEQLEPMEIVQRYTTGFHSMMDIFNTHPPSIEPRATGHIIEQIEMVKSIIDNGLAYESNGSIYFDTTKYIETHKDYGQLSGRVVDDLLVETRDDLKNQGEKRHPSDFAIWIKADPSHIMRWDSPWSNGFPGWHLECSAMSTKYLGDSFDIHGGGTDLKFPHHENEIAQNVGSCGCAPAKYWLHTNMLLMNGKKMSKSDGNSITPQQLFTGDSEHISKAFSPMVMRFFMIQSHYRSPLDLTNDALLAAEKSYKRLMDASKALQNLSAGNKEDPTALDKEINALINQAYEDMNDDFNTPKALSRLFELTSKINSLKDGKIASDQLSESSLINLKKNYEAFLFDIFGLKDEVSSSGNGKMEGLMSLIIELRQQVRENKDWATSDKIRDGLKELNIKLKDGKDGTEWTIE